MKMLIKVLGLLALALTIVPPVLFLTGSLALPAMKAVMLGGCVLWFATAPFFLRGGEA